MTDSTWDIARSSGVSLSNGNLTATTPPDGTSDYTGSNWTQSDVKLTGKRALRLDIAMPTPYPNCGVSFGFANADVSFDPFPGADANSISAWPYDGYGDWSWQNFSSDPYIVGDYVLDGNVEGHGTFSVHLAVDLDARIFWCKIDPGGVTGYWNGDVVADPTTGVGGFDIQVLGDLCIFVMLAWSGVVTADFVPASRPAGFDTWQDAVAAPPQQNVIATVPLGYVIDDIIIRETAGLPVTGGIKIGTTDGGTEITASIVVDASSFVRTPAADLGLAGPFAGDPQQIYIQGATDWGGANVEIIIGLKPA